MRLRSPLFVFALAAAALYAPSSARTEPNSDAAPSRALVLHDLSRAHSARERLLLALSFSQRDELGEILGAEEIPATIADWHRVRLALQQGEPANAQRALEKLVKKHRTLPALLAPMADDLDRFCLEAALDLKQTKLAEFVWRHPRAAHEEDAVWKALGARLELARGEISNSILRYESAWDRASSLQRRERVFAYRALTLLRAGDPRSAIESWLAYAKGLRSGAEKLWSLAFWDEHPGLLQAAARGDARHEVARWLASNARRESALQLALAAWKDGTGLEARESYLIAVEQLYRLRRHEELARLLEEPRPRGLDEEDEAALAAYPFGVLRRGGASVEIAAGFDSVASAYAGTRRAVEALWEAAWMWELSGEESRAEDNFLRYAKKHANAPFAHAAALRAIYLPFKEGDYARAEERAHELKGSLGGAEEAAAGLWLAQRSARQLGEQKRAEAWAEELEAKFPDSPFLGLPDSSHTLRADSQTGDLDRLYEKQLDSFQLLAQRLEVPDLFAPRAPQWIRVALLFHWGFFERGERALEETVLPSRRTPEVQLRACAIAWASGRAEQQARSAWWLQVALKGRDEELDTALQQVTFPTPFAAVVRQEARARGLAPAALWAIMRRESFYEPEVVSRAGAYGLLQLLPDTARRMADKLADPPLLDPLRLLDPRANLRYGSAYFAQLLEEANGDPLQALAAYNAGEGNGRRWKARVGEGAPAAEMLITISYSETRDYVYNVLRFWKVYERIFPSVAF